MKRLLASLLFGQSLRHRPVALRRGEQRPVRAVAITGATERDVTSLLFPVSLNPLLIGLSTGSGDAPAGALTLRMEDVASSRLLGTIDASPAGSIEHRGIRIDLLRPTRSSVRCVPAPVLAWKHALAWRQAQRNARDPNAFHMSYPDLRTLNVFYMMPRPVYLISVTHEDAGNLFPMDLVGPLAEDRFLLALRLTSPSVEPMRLSRRIVAAGAPAAMKETVYRLGAHHKERAIDWDALPIPIEPSAKFQIPLPRDALGVMELDVLHAEPVGSHMFFVTSVASKSVLSDAPQLCHVSDMYARWRASQGKPFVDA